MWPGTPAVPTREAGPGAGLGRAVQLTVTLIVSLAITGGVWLRMRELSRKPWWADEVATWVVISGCTAQDVGAAWDGRPHTADALLACQRVKSQGTAREVGRALLDDGAQNLPVFFLMSRAAVLALGWEWAPRLISAIASTLALLAGAALARELFGSWRAGALMAALAAVSPLHVRYALEARVYASWSLFTVVSTWLLLRACRRNHAKDWVLFTLAELVTLQTHLLALPVSLALLAWHRIGGRIGASGEASPLRRHFLALAVSISFLLPWGLAGALHHGRVQETLDWTTQHASVLDLSRRWLGILTSVFVRTGADGGFFGAGEEAWRLAARSAIGLGIAALVGFSMRRVWRENPTAARFILLMGAPLLLMMAVPDLALGGRRSMVARYWVPVWWAAGLIVAGALSSWIGARTRKTAVAATLTVGLMAAGGLWSCARMIPSAVWWDTDNGVWPLLVSEARRAEGHAYRYWIERLSPNDTLAFARLLPSTTPLVLGMAPPGDILPQCQILSVPPAGPGDPSVGVYRCPVRENR